MIPGKESWSMVRKRLITGYILACAVRSGIGREGGAAGRGDRSRPAALAWAKKELAGWGRYPASR